MYLRAWLLLGGLGLDQSHTFAFGVVLAAAMFLSFMLIIGRVPIGTGIVMALAVCSPAVMFAVERANMDVALFSLVAISILFWQKVPRAAPVISPTLVLIGATAKVYPVFALPAFVFTRNRVAARAALVCTVAFGIYVLLNLPDVKHAAEIATQGQGFSYGARILPAHIYHYSGADRWAGPRALKQLIAVVPLAFIAGVIAVGVRRRLASPMDEDEKDASVARLAFHAGALIYLGTFAVANNFDYRLVFLLLTFRQLTEWAGMRAHKFSTLAAATLVAVIVLLWVGSLSEQLHFWDELASWAVAALLVAIVAATMPSLETVRRSVLGGVKAAGTSHRVEW